MQRPVIQMPARVAAHGGRVPVADAVIQGQAAQRVHAPGVSAAQPVQHINIMGAFLQQQTCRFAALRVPIFEEGIAAIALAQADQFMINFFFKSIPKKPQF